MNIAQLKRPVTQESHGPHIEKMECDGPQLLKVIAQINANRDKVTSMSVQGIAHYILTVKRNKP